jgi:hypothetical protein
MMITTRSVLPKQGEGTVPTSTTMMMTTTCFPAFTSNITDKSYPKEFKPVGIPKYDSKQDSRQWI